MNVCLELKDARRLIAAQPRSEDAGRCARCCRDHTKIWPVGEVGVRVQEVGVIQHVVSLDADLKLAALEPRNLQALHQCEVGVEEARPPELVAHLTAEPCRIGEVGTVCRSRATEAGSGR